jgi:hypothetical protein
MRQGVGLALYMNERSLNVSELREVFAHALLVSFPALDGFGLVA